MVRTVRAGGIREGSEGHYNLSGALLSLSPSLGVEWEKSDTTEWIRKHLLIPCVFRWFHPKITH